MQCSYNSILEGLVVDDLKESWKVFIGSDRFALADGCHGENISKMLLQLSLDITESRINLELHLFESISCVSKLSLKKRGDLQVKSFEFLRLGYSVPLIAQRDLLRIALDSKIVRYFNPFLSVSSQDVIFNDILLWLQLCVLEDKVARITKFNTHGLVDSLVQEIVVNRTWNVQEYPYWLVFEVEGQLQIRPQQYAVAFELIRNPGSILQLNMGEGKTELFCRC
jgi:hypothetical protein